MSAFRYLIFKRKNKYTLFMVALICFSFSANSQVRSYSLVYSDNIKGGTTFFGNTLLNIVDSGQVNIAKMNDNRVDGYSSYGNDGQNMQFVDIDGNTGNGSVTRNSSSSDLILPEGINMIKLARLYWGGRVNDSEYNLSNEANKKIKIRKGLTNPYADVTASAMDKTAITAGYTQYQAYADITSFVKNNGAGTYEVGNVPLSTGIISNGGNHGGWCIVVVYENASISYNSIRLYDGFQVVYNGGDSTISTVTLNGLNVPSGVLQASDARMGVIAWEGDANLTGDFLTINGNTFSNATNPFDNPWNGTITTNGQHVTSKNPNYTNQMGVDIDMFDIGAGYGILPNASSVTLQFGTEADKYFPGVFAFSIRMKDPTITLEKTVKDANSNHLAESGEVLTYTLKGTNTGKGNAGNIILTDTLPNTVTYKPGTLKVISSPGISSGVKTYRAGDDVAEYRINGSEKTVIFRIGTGATSIVGGTLAANESYEVQFQVTVNEVQSGTPVPSIMNIARITSQSDAGVKFVDDATAILNPEAGPTPVILSQFTASFLAENVVQLDWATSMEINCRQFIVERSYDGAIFSKVLTVTGNGTTSLFHSYSATDQINSFTSDVVYYRLKQIDLDGKENLSDIIALKIKNTNQSINISPNPFIDHLNVNVESTRDEIVVARIINVSGKIIFSKKIALQKGFNHFTLNELSHFPAGNYFLQITSATKNITKKITK